MKFAVAPLLAVSLALGCDRPKVAAPPAQHVVSAADAPASTQVATLPTVTVPLGNATFTLEVADDEQERETGLMYRKSMPADHGMLFVFQDSAVRPFWMKNTLIPLDIAYLDEHGVVLNVEQMYPLDLNGVPSDGPARYAIELNQGTAAKIGLKAGDRVALPANGR